MKTLLFVIALMYSSFLYPVTIYVDASASGSNNGTSWSNAYTSLQAALDDADSSDQIWVKAGVYKPTKEYGGIGDRFKCFEMKNGVAIYGGFSGTESSIDDRTDFGPGGLNETTLSGDLSGNDIFDVNNEGYQEATGNDNSLRVVFVGHIDSTAILNGFTIRGGNAFSESMSTHYWGGGISMAFSSPILTNLTITSNSGGWGGGISISDSSPTITNVAFISNFAYHGGGLINTSPSVTLTNCSFTLNVAAVVGGGILNINSSSTILNNCILWGNSTEFYSVTGSDLTLNYCCYRDGINDGTYYATNNNITSNPKFVNPDDNDLRLTGNSPAVNAGLNSYNSESYDIRGEARIQNVNIDMGAYEWTDDMDSDGAIIYVDASASGSNTGTSWTNAYNSLQSALDVALSNDQIWTATGIYKPSYAYDLTNTSRYYHFRVKNGVAIYGGFAGTETFLSQRTDFGVDGTNETILSGDLNDNGKDDNDCYHVIYNPDENPDIDATAILDGFTIKGGNANGTNPHFSGGGLYNNSASPTISNVAFSLNSASTAGGGMYCYASASALSDLIFTSNSASSGGGLYNESSPLTITNVTFSLNYASACGGGIYNNASSPVMSNVVFSRNSSYYGAGMFNEGSSPSSTNVTFSSNSATQGGGVLNHASSSPVFNNCIIWGNTASSTGNEVYLNSGTTTMSYSCYGNDANDIVNDGGTFTASDNNITFDPKFVYPDSADFRLAGNSPAINTGNNEYVQMPNPVILSDIRGEDRIHNTTIDMGAYEWTTGVDPEAPVPVELVSFTAASANSSTGNSIVILNWQTATEVNNYGFEVERSLSISKGNWEMICFIPGNGNCNSIKNYSYTDTSVPVNANPVLYRLKQLDTDGRFDYSDIVSVKIEKITLHFELSQNYPNPFNPVTTIKYSVPNVMTGNALSLQQNVTLKVYDILGNETATLVNSQHSAGDYEVLFDAGNLSSGVYYYRLTAGKFAETKKFVLLK